MIDFISAVFYFTGMAIYATVAILLFCCFMIFLYPKIKEWLFAPTLEKPIICQTLIGVIPYYVVFRPDIVNILGFDSSIPGKYVIQFFDGRTKKSLLSYTENSYARANWRYKKLMGSINKCSPWVMNLVEEKEHEGTS